MSDFLEYVTKEKLEYYRREATEFRDLAVRCENPEVAQRLRDAADYFLSRFSVCAPAHGLQTLPEH